MNKELRILSAFISDRESYNSVANLVSPDDFTEMSAILCKMIVEYYDGDSNSTCIDKDWLKDKIIERLPNPKHHSPLITVVDEKVKDVSLPNAVKDYIALKRTNLGTIIAEKLLAGQDATEEMEVYQRCGEERSMSTELDGELPSLAESLEAVSQENMLPVHPKSFAEAIGGGLPPCNMAVYAYSEVGKSLFAINLCSSMLYHGKKVLYIENEEAKSATHRRFVSRLSLVPINQLADRPDAEELAIKNGLNNLKLVELDPGTPDDVEAAIEKYSPDFVVVNQLMNMDCGSKKLGTTDANEFMAKKIRSIQKRHNISTCVIHQADGDSENRIYLLKRHMYYSNIGMQGTFDLMVGIGMDTAMEANNLRMLCLTKNKLSANHDSLSVKINPLLSKMDDV